MPTIKIDGQDYDSGAISEDAKKQLQMLQYVEREIATLQAQSAVLQTARIAYINALKQAVAPFAGDTIKLG